jgi:hypothetical protein
VKTIQSSKMKTFKILIILVNLYLIVECNVIQLTNFEVNPGKFQGDIILTEDQENAIFAETQNKTGLINLNARWLKDSKGMVNVPYIFDTVYSMMIKIISILFHSNTFIFFQTMLRKLKLRMHLQLLKKILVFDFL